MKTINLLKEIKTIILMFFGIFRHKKLLLSFEYGVIISQVAKEQNIELTPEIIKRAENVIMDSFCRYSPQELSVEMLPIILSIFETDMSS